jgi:hypothetical protein
MTMAKHAKKKTPAEERAEARAQAWAALGQLMWVVSRPDYPPKPKPAPPTKEKE